MKKAEAAAIIPMKVTFKAPFIIGWPVTLLLQKPKINKHSTVIMADINNPRCGLFVKIYPINGISPPTAYESPMVKALFRALAGSGFSNPNSNFIIKSTHLCLSLASSSAIRS